MMQIQINRSVVLVCIILFAAACAGPRESKESVSAPSAGTYETANPWEPGYLYYRLELKQEKDRYTGTLLAGNYLSKSEAGGYVGPDVLVDCTVEGMMENDELLLTLTVTKVDRMEESAPDLLTEMNFPDLDSDTTATLWTFRMVNGQLNSVHASATEGGDPEIVPWEKIK